MALSIEANLFHVVWIDRDHISLSVFVIIHCIKVFFALLRHVTLTPCMRSDINFLCFWGDDSQMMARALLATNLVSAVRWRLVILLQIVAVLHLLGVVVRMCLLEALMVVLYSNVENAIIHVFHQFSLFHELWGPIFVILVAPFAVVDLAAPGVSEFEKAHIIAQRDKIKYSEGMAQYYTPIVSICVFARPRGASHDVSRFTVLNKVVP